MTMPISLGQTEMTTDERIEFLLGVIACTLTGKKPMQLFPWVRRGLNDLEEAVRG